MCLNVMKQQSILGDTIMSYGDENQSHISPALHVICIKSVLRSSVSLCMYFIKPRTLVAILLITLSIC
jgi:hypothetical protein